ncbi:MAG: nitrite reductase/ring-hydroxylating ferredoxin subunit [Candidatus Poriferisodalaceae bacterium]|jgi:nitrite reductase/ring-hydroxylating ferredoxin subunit
MVHPNNRAPGTYSSLVDAEAGIIDRGIFVDDQIFKDEQEAVFTRAWLFVAHETQIPNVGDYFVSRMGTESVIVSRDRTGKVHVFLNSCRHRGMKVCRYDEGNATSFTCPYHAWQYGSDGRLLGVPQQKELYPDLDKSLWPLAEVAQMAVYKGTIWATWDPKAPSFLDSLGDAKIHLDLTLDGRDGSEGGSEIIAGVHKWIVPCNWKLPAENFLGDTYHNISHESVDMIGIGPSAATGAKGRRDADILKYQHVWATFPGGHGVHSAIRPEGMGYKPTFQDNPVVEKYYRECFEAREKRLGDSARLMPFVGNLFPNISFHGTQPRNLCVWHPHTATTTEIWRFFIVDADAPEEVKDLLRRYYMRYSGPAGMTEQDDMENWNYATAGSQGPIARRYPFNYQQSLHASTFDGPVPGQVSTQISEQNPRHYYATWAAFMDGASWDQIYAMGRGPK